MEQLLQALNDPIPLIQYTAVMMGSDGRVLVSGHLLAIDDADAVAQAASFAKNCAIDLWDGLRFVERVEPATSKSA